MALTISINQAASFTVSINIPGPQGPVGPAGPAGPQGVIGPQGIQGVQGNHGIQGVQGIQGIQGVKGDKGDEGQAGIQGPIGATGTQGPQGIAGENGATGPQGPQGEIGPIGPTGPQGIQGIQGINGDKYATTSTTSLSVSNGIKTLTVATGLAYSTQQAVVVAHDASHHMHGDVTSYNAVSGVMVVDIKNHTGAGTYAAWSVNLEGAAGIQGPQGIQGVAGETGPAGPTGPQGPTGATGATGATGSQGDAGATGPQGPQGDQGVQGIQGIEGPQGIQGEQGVPGPSGDAGAQGVAGVGVPTGGNSGQVLSKIDGTDYNTQWATPSGGTFTGGAITSAITLDNGAGKVSYFASNFVGIDETLTSGSITNKTGYVDSDNVLISKTEDEYGVTYTSTSRYAYRGFQALSNSSGGSSNLDVGYSSTGVISFSTSGMSGSYGYTITPGTNIVFTSSTYPNSASFGLGGLTFSDGTTQTTAASGGGSPPFSNSVWYNGGWYSANLSTVFDSSYNYVNVLSF